MSRRPGGEGTNLHSTQYNIHSVTAYIIRIDNIGNRYQAAGFDRELVCDALVHIEVDSFRTVRESCYQSIVQESS